MRLIFFLIFSFFNLLNGQVKSEIEILNRMIDNSFKPVQDFLLSDTVKSVRLKFISDNEKINSLVKSKILSNFQENFTSQYLLEIIVNNFDTRFPSIVSFPLFGEEKINREITLALSYNLSKDGLSVFYHSSKENYNDTISVSDLRFSIYDTDVSKRIPTVPIWRSLVEPAIIITVSGVIVYLFFTVRSK